MASLQNIGIPNEYIDQWKADGKKTAATVCCHIPEEIIHAAGLLPFRIRATGCKNDSEGELWMSSYSCGHVRACLQRLLDGDFSFLDGFVATDGCLMMQRMFDNWKFIDKETYRLQLNVPRMLHPGLSTEFYRKELAKLREGMEELSGNKITDEALLASIELYNETRALIRQLYDLRKSDEPVVSGTECLRITLAAMSMPKEDFNVLLKAFLEEAKTREPIQDTRARLMVIGSSMDDPEYLQLIEDQDALVVTDCHCFGSRYLWEPVTVEEGETPLEALARCYLSRPICPRMCNLHDELYDFILTSVKEHKVDGIIYLKMKNCDPWGGESAYLQDKFKAENIPVLVMEREEITTNAGQVAVRVEAFVEMLEGGLD